MIISQSIIMKG